MAAVEAAVRRVAAAGEVVACVEEAVVVALERAAASAEEEAAEEEREEMEEELCTAFARRAPKEERAGVNVNSLELPFRRAEFITRPYASCANLTAGGSVPAASIRLR